jgi:hypothetical protein
LNMMTDLMEISLALLSTTSSSTSKRSAKLYSVSNGLKNGGLLELGNNQCIMRQVWYHE